MAAYGRQQVAPTLGHQPAQANHAAKCQELLGCVGGGGGGIEGEQVQKERLVPFVGHGLCQLDVAARSGQPRLGQEVRLPVVDAAQGLAIGVDFAHGSSLSHYLTIA